jgi:hypothetical protein
LKKQFTAEITCLYQVGRSHVKTLVHGQTHGEGGGRKEKREEERKEVGLK